MSHPFSGDLVNSSRLMQNSDGTMEVNVPTGSFGIMLQGTFGDITSVLKVTGIEARNGTCTPVEGMLNVGMHVCAPKTNQMFQIIIS